MTDPKFTELTPWKTRGGKKAAVTKVHPNGDLSVYHYDLDGMLRHNSDGCFYTGRNTSQDLLTPWQEPRSGEMEVWVNIYLNNHGFHETRDAADLHATSDRIARVKLTGTWVEGAFDE